MNINNLTVMFVLVSLLAATNSFAEEINNKYQDVFYPNGMPVRSSMYGEGPTEYELHDELTIPDTDLIVVLFSEKVPGSTSDTEHYIYISILRSTNGMLSVKYQNEITGYLKLSAEDLPGYFESMGGGLQYINISNDVKVVLLGMGNDLSGSGGITSSSDVFFLIKNEELVPVLELLEDCGGGRSGTGFVSFYYTFVYLADTDSDGSTDVITQKYNYENNGIDNIFISELAPSLDVYKYDSTEEKFISSGQITTLPANAVMLDQGGAPDVDALTKAGCCSGN